VGIFGFGLLKELRVITHRNGGFGATQAAQDNGYILYRFQLCSKIIPFTFKNWDLFIKPLKMNQKAYAISIPLFKIHSRYN
jgi:hypothetical protein